MKGSANRGRTRLERSTGAHLSAGAFCCLTAWTGPVWVPRNPSCSWCGVGRRAFAQTGPRAVISAHIQASIVNPVFVEYLVRFVRIYPLRYGLSFQVSYLNNPTIRRSQNGMDCSDRDLVPRSASLGDVPHCVGFVLSWVRHRLPYQVMLHRWPRSIKAKPKPPMGSPRRGPLAAERTPPRITNTAPNQNKAMTFSKNMTTSQWGWIRPLVVTQFKMGYQETG